MHSEICPTAERDHCVPLKTVLVLSVLAMMLVGCGDAKKSTPPVPVPPAQINTYFALATERPTNSANGVSSGFTFALDHSSANNFDEEDITGGAPLPISKGVYSSANGFLSPALNPYNGAVVPEPEVGNWVLEQRGVMGLAYLSAPNSTGLDGNTSGPDGEKDTSQNLVPFVNNTSCPVAITGQTYQYLTFPGANGSQSWDYTADTAYGSVVITTVQGGPVVNLTASQQFLLPASGVAAGTPVTANPGPQSISGACGVSAAGTLVSVSYVDALGVAHFAEVSLADGFVLEMNTGVGIEASGVSNIMGAGYGAVGMLQPSGQVDTSGIIADSFQGFIHVPDSYTATSSFSGGAGSSSACKALQSSLKTLDARPSSSTLYGGEYADNNPAANQTAHCDMAIDLGPQDKKNNGLYPQAAVFIGTSFPLNNTDLGTGTGAPYSFPAIALAGQINGQNAVFVLAEDTVAGLGHPLALYLLHAQ